MANDSDDMWREGGLVQRHRHLLDTGFMSDCTFLVGDEDGEKKRFKCHQFVLGHGSGTLYNMFYGDLKEEEVEINDIQPKHFQMFLHYMYVDEVELKDVDTALGLAYVANKYVVKTLLKKCLEFLKQNFEDPKFVCQILEFCRLELIINVEDLQQNCIDYIKANTNKVLSDKNLVEVQRDTLVTILEQEELCLFSEVELFSACLRWARKNKFDETEEENGSAKQENGSAEQEPGSAEQENGSVEQENGLTKTEQGIGLATTLGPALKLIKFLTFTANEFASLVVPTKILPEKTCLAILCRIVTGNGDIQDEVSNCCDSRATLELLVFPLTPHNTHSQSQVGFYQIVVSTNIDTYLHSIQVLASRSQIPIGGEYEENVSAAILLANTEQTSQSFIGLVKRDESFSISFKKPFCIMSGVQYVLRLVYSDPNMVYVSARPQVGQVSTKYQSTFSISSHHNHINAIYISMKK